jgi:N-acyl-D-amino-acid deacylase
VLDLAVKNGRIVDGTGNPWFYGDVGIKDGVIVEVGRVQGRSQETLDACGRVISPGFIDGHTHSDLMILDEPLSEIKLQQGVTTCSEAMWNRSWVLRSRIGRGSRSSST